MLNEEQKKLLDDTIAFAKANNLGFTTQAFHTLRGEQHCHCASGAACLMREVSYCSDFTVFDPVGIECNDVYAGNDGDESWYRKDSAGYEFGRLYREAMLNG